MNNFEDLLVMLAEEKIPLHEAEHSQNPKIKDRMFTQAGRMRVNIRKSLDAWSGISDYLKPYPIRLIDNASAALNAVGQLKSEPLLGLDTETAKTADHPRAGLNPHVSRIRLVQLFNAKEIFVFDVERVGGLEFVKGLCDTPMVAHNAAFDAQHFHHAGIEFRHLDCTMLMGRVFLNRNLSLKDMAAQALGLTMDKTLQVSDWNRIPLLPEQVQYAALDTVIAFELSDVFHEWFKERDPEDKYRGTYEFLRNLIYPTVRQMATGIQIDRQGHNKIITGWEIRLAEVTDGLEKDGLHKPGSVKSKQKYLVAKLSEDELADWPKTRTGLPATDKNALGSLSGHPTLGLLAEYNLLTSRLANYGQKLVDLAIDEKVYPSYQIAGMVSGRFGCTNPNIQNQPRSGFKHIYTAPEGCCFITGDLAQVEIRVAGLLSEDPVINQAYAEGRDLHRLMASKITGKPESEITKGERQAAKAVNFGLIFGGGARMLRQTARTQYHTDMTLAEAQRAKDIFHATYAGLTEYQRLIVKHTNQLDESETWGCRLTRHYTWKDHYATGEYKDIYAPAINFPVQGSAWEILANTILYIDSNASAGVQISHHVYDELVLLAPDQKEMEAAHLLKAAFIHGYETVFPGCCKDNIVEVGSGKNWFEAGQDESIILR